MVAAGGTGKTALVNKALHEAKLSDRAGVFVWSFYEDPHTDAFLREAFIYFTGEKDKPTGGMLERLQIALSGAAPHIVILDGLERVQSDEGPRRRGELEDLQLKRLVRALAGGTGNSNVALSAGGSRQLDRRGTPPNHAGRPRAFRRSGSGARLGRER